MADKLVVLGGTGDAYLICALAQVYRDNHHREPEIVVRQRLSAVCDLFPGLVYSIDEDLVNKGERERDYQTQHQNTPFTDQPYYTHPCFVRSPTKVDALTAHPDASQADMYRMMLHLPPDAPLTLPTIPQVVPQARSIVVITESTSWPNTQPAFWAGLIRVLLGNNKWNIFINVMEHCTLTGLFEACASAEFVIGPQCGVMSILTTGRFPCRKIFCTPSVDDNFRPDFWARQTYPYGYVTKFAGEDYEVDEYKIEDGNHQELINTILYRMNTLQGQLDPNPVTSVTMPLTPGDFLDRYAVLAIKGDKQVLTDPRELLRYKEQYRLLMRRVPEAVQQHFESLLALHAETYNVLQELVPASLESDSTELAQAHSIVIRLNKRRVQIKQEIDRVCHAPYTEVKTYW